MRSADCEANQNVRSRRAAESAENVAEGKRFSDRSECSDEWFNGMAVSNLLDICRCDSAALRELLLSSTWG